MSQMKDIYDREVERLTADPEMIEESWKSADPLFQFCGHGSCLTMIRSCIGDAVTPRLTAEIRADERIPEWADDIRPEHLPIFAEWQRRIDKELNRKPPQE